MRALKVYIGVVTVMLVCAIGIGVYVWYTLQTLERNIEKSSSPASLENATGTQASTDTDPGTAGESARTAPISLRADSLTPSQQSMLRGLGYTQDSFTITEAMIACAKEAIGEVRLAEIVSGSAPSPLESLKLIPCFKAR